MSTFTNAVPAVLLKLHHGTLAIARSLGRLGVPVYAVGNASPPADLSRYLKLVQWPIEEAPEAASVEFLRETARGIGRRCILIPTSDRTALFVADHAAELEADYLFARPPADLPARFASKREMTLLAKSVGVPVPETLFPRDRREAQAYLETARLPVMLKAIDGARLEARTGLRMLRVDTPDEFLKRYDELEEPENPNLMLQEYIPGGDDSIWMFNGYFDSRSECLFGATGQKLRQTPVYAGATSLGICVPNETVRRQTLSFMKSVGYQGILDIGYRYDARDERYKVLDVNPRVGSTFRLWTGRDGLDVVRALYRDLTGQPVPADSVPSGRKWLIEDKDLESSVRYWRDGRLTLLSWLGSFRGVRELAWFALDDLRPFLAVASQVMRRALRLLWRGLWSRDHGPAPAPPRGTPKAK